MAVLSKIKYFGIKFLLNVLNLVDPHGYISSLQLDYVYKNELKNLNYISVRSVLNFCTYHNKQQRSDIDRIDFNFNQNKIESNLVSIFINSDSLESFCKMGLPSTISNCIIFIGNSDRKFQKDMIHFPAIKYLLEHSAIVKLYIQNLGFSHEKVSLLPIGLDFYTLWEKPRKNGFSYRISPLLHEKYLRDVINGSKPLQERNNLIYCNWHFQMDRGDRSECYSKVDKTLCFFEKNHINRLDNYSQIAKFKFVLCPAGIGWDSYRLWETIVLGSIPILKNNEFSKNLSSLPCIIINDWDDLSSELLEIEFMRILRTNFDFNLIHNSYWKNIVNSNELKKFIL